MQEGKRQKMKLFLLERKDRYEYDEFIAFVVCAESEEDAFNVVAENEDVNECNWPTENKELVTIKEIGTAGQDIERTIILDSFWYP